MFSFGRFSGSSRALNEKSVSTFPGGGARLFAMRINNFPEESDLRVGGAAVLSYAYARALAGEAFVRWALVGWEGMINVA